MADMISRTQRHYIMSQVRSTNTKPERKLRKALFEKGFRYRLYVKTLPGTPDIVLPRYRTAIFVNGCFWHGHHGCKKHVIPETHRDFWKDKIIRNRERDMKNYQKLEALAWYVITVWECELSRTNIEATTERLSAEIRSNEKKWQEYLLRRKEDRQFSIEQNRKHREIVSQLEAALDRQFLVPTRIRRASKEELNTPVENNLYEYITEQSL